MHKTLSIGCVAMMVLSACGGAGTDLTLVRAPLSADSIEMQRLVDEFGDITNDIDRLDGTPLASVPSVDRFDYDGVMTVLRERNVYISNGSGVIAEQSSDTFFAAISEITLDVDFDAGTITGTAASFYDIDDRFVSNSSQATARGISGSVDVDLAQDLTAPAIFTGTIDGFLSPSTVGFILIDEDATGVLFGGNGEYFSVGSNNGLFDQVPSFPSIQEQTTIIVVSEQN